MKKSIRKTSVVQQIMTEVVVYGGLLATRAEVYRDVLASIRASAARAGATNAREREWRLMADRTAMFICPTATPFDLANRRTLASVG